MTLFYLVRHGDNDTVGSSISGRRPGVALNSRGRAQAQAVAERLSHCSIERIYASPMERTRETAQFLADRLGIGVEILQELNEVDFGEWTGAAFADLEKDARWRRFNRVRSITRIPQGEWMPQVQLRVVRSLESLRAAARPEARLAIVGHGDPLRVALCFYAGIPIDLMHNIQLDLASVSVLAVDDHGGRIRCLNHTGPVPAG